MLNMVASPEVAARPATPAGEASSREAVRRSAGRAPDNNFDLVRMLAASAVLVSHSYPIWGRRPDPLQLVMNGVPIGEIAVSVFFVISGYLVCQSWVFDPHPLRYLARRALRLLPALYVTLLVSTFVAGPLLTSLPARDYWASPMTWDYLRGFGVFWLQGSLPGVFADSFYPLAFNGPLWTIRIEAACYIVLMGLGVLGVLRSRLFTVLAAAACIGTYLAIHARAGTFQAVSILYMDALSLSRLAALFFSGAALYQCRDLVPRLPWVAVLVLGLLMAIASSPYYPLAFHLAFPYAILCLALTPLPVLSRFGRFGDFSYGTYLFAWPVQQAVMSAWGHALPLWGYIAVSLAITVALAAASWHLIEKRALARKPRARGLPSAQAPALAR